MNRHYRNRLQGSLLRAATAVTAALAVLAAPAGFSAAADPAKPAVKDSNKKAQPANATLTASVTPAEARPGDVVTYKVTAKVDPNWHIYAFNKKQPDDGPKATQFDFFDTAGLKPQGEWTPSAKPVRKSEPAFPDLPFVEYHEDEVTWSLKLKVPDDAAPGKKTLRCQAGYQICSDQNCSFPGRWTLDDTTLTIKPASPPAPAPAPAKPADAGSPRSGLAAPVVLLTGLVAADEPPAGPQPAKKDTSARFRPKEATLTAAVEPANARPGDTVQLKVTAKLGPNWHIYKYSTTQPDEGPILTTFDLFNPGGLQPEGDWTPSKPPIQKKDPAFEGLPFVEFHEDEVTWSHPLKVPADAAPGARSIQVQVGYMICAKVCSRPGQWTLPAATVTIEPGAGAPAAGEAKPTAAETKPTEPAPAAGGDAKSATAAASAAGETKPTAGAAATAAAAETKPTAGPTKDQTKPTADEAASPQKLADMSFFGFLALCAGGGLLALAMPCVWPMIPVTVNFFVKQGQQKGSTGTTGLAITYCLAIIGIFTAIGALFAAFLGAQSLSKLGNNPWLNLGIAGLFVVFGLSLLGLFEIRLPNFLLNASVQGESRGGLVGVVFMALTLTITSFTCTFPVVGALLVSMSQGEYFRPIVGMLVFASVVALPFFLLALSPGLLSKMPKSGDWMNTVKVVGGLVELGAAVKFLNTAELRFVVAEEAWTNAYTVLTIWIVLALICGMYLLGLFRTDHDHGEAQVGPGRILSGWAFLALALYLTPALFGRVPQGKVWYTVVGLLPDASELTAGSHAALATAGGPGAGPVAATSTDPETAEREQSVFHGVRWGMSYAQALEQSRSTGKPVLIDFTGVNCANCRLMEQQVLPRPEVVKALGNFIPIELYTDSVQIKSLTADQRTKLAERNIELEIKLTDEATNPNYVVVDGDGRLLGKLGGWNAPADFIKFLDDSRARFRPGATASAPDPATTAAPVEAAKVGG